MVSTIPIWIQDTDALKLLQSLEPARVVGGVVRDYLLGHPSLDIDIATVHKPEEVMKKAVANGYKVFPTGLQHGTVTCVINKKKYEVTTLRIDEQTYGRKADVVFCDSWEADAARRDLTINALYSDASGRIYDYFGGQSDLQNGCIKFIGQPDQRIQEDYLRIMRYFRFFSHYGKYTDSTSLVACANNIDGLTKIAKERIVHEFFRLLDGPNMLQALQYMQDINAFKYTTLPSTDIKKLEMLLQSEQIVGKKSRAIARFATSNGSYIHLPLSNTIKSELKILRNYKSLICLADYILILNTYYEELFWDIILLHGQNHTHFLQLLTPWWKHRYSLTGKEIMTELNTPPGPLIGTMQKEALNYFCQQKEPVSNTALLNWLRKRF